MQFYDARYVVPVSPGLPFTVLSNLALCARRKCAENWCQMCVLRTYFTNACEHTRSLDARSQRRHIQASVSPRTIMQILGRGTVGIFVLYFFFLVNFGFVKSLVSCGIPSFTITERAEAT